MKSAINNRLDTIQNTLNEILELSNSQVQKVDLIIKEFGNIVTYTSLDALAFDVPIEIDSGVIIQKNQSKDDNIHLSCSMDRNAVFPVHCHDFYEYMFITKGKVKEIYTEITIEKGTIHELSKSKFHGFLAIENTFMHIVASRKKIPKTTINVFSN